MSATNILIERSLWLGNTAYMSFFHGLAKHALISLSDMKNSDLII
jgi:hypothetical protein